MSCAVVIGVISFQYLVGTSALMSCGLHHAIDEAVHHISNDWDEEYIDAQSVSTFS